MAVRLIAGRAGSGKTHWCLGGVRDALGQSVIDGPKLILLVPEQAALQMERALLAGLPNKALGRCEVLSFRRLAHRILNQVSGPTPTLLTPTGRAMVLRHLMARNKGKLLEFGKIAERTGFINALGRGIVELFQEAVSPEALTLAASAAEAESDPTYARLHDAALVYQLYLEYLGSQRVDPEGVLDLARSRLDQVSWLSGARIWIDGFAGLTQQQSRMIVSLAQRANEINIALLMDAGPGHRDHLESEPDDFELFARTRGTWFQLVTSLREAGVEVEPEIVLGREGCPRFAISPMLERLERRLFAMPLPKPGAIGAEVAGSRLREREDVAGDHASVRMVRAYDRRAEVAAAVTAIVDLVQRKTLPLRYRDIAIIVRDLEPYHELVSAALAERRIPFFIDRRRSTFHHPLVQLVRSLLSMHGGGAFDQAIISLLKTGLSNLPDDAAESLENYLLAHGILGAAPWDEKWNYPVNPNRPEKAHRVYEKNALAAVVTARDSLRETLKEWWPSSVEPSARPACRNWLERLFKVLGQLRVSEQLGDWCIKAHSRGDLDEVQEHEQVMADLGKLMDEIAETLGDEPMNGRQFQEVVEAGLSEFTLGLVPATLDQVLVGSIERSRHPPVRAVFVLGFGEGQFPARPSDQEILGDDERERLAALGTSAGRSCVRQLLDERMLAYIAFTRPSDFLWISYPLTDDAGRALAASPYWPALKAALPEVEEELADITGGLAASSISSLTDLAAGMAVQLRAWCEERAEATDANVWPALYEWARKRVGTQEAIARALTSFAIPARAQLTPEAARKLWPKPYTTSVTRLEKLAQCPFQHYAAYGLRLEKRPIHDVSALDFGRLYHGVLEQFVNELVESGRRLRDVTPAEIATNLNRLFEKGVTEYAEQFRLDAGRRRSLAWRGRRELPTAVGAEQALLGKTPLRPRAVEKGFGERSEDQLPALEVRMKSGEVVKVQGKIDRIDLLQVEDQTLAVVFDYKRSIGRRLKLDEVYHGLALQLLSYLLVVRDHADKVAGADGRSLPSKITPAGAFYLPLIGKYTRVDHPRDAEEAGFRPFDPFRPRGIVDFDWIDQLEANEGSQSDDEAPRTFQVKKTKEGRISNFEHSDAVNTDGLPILLERVRAQMAELCERWLAGEIAVWPVQLNSYSPCPHCDYRSVCRIEYATRQTRVLLGMNRTQVMQRLAGGEEESDE